MLDIIFFVFIAIGIIKGIQRGFIVAIFSIIAVIVGLAAAMKLSTVTADYLDNSINISARWLPVVSFVLVFLLVVILVRLGANLLQKTVEIAFLGWVNRLAGAILYAFLYAVVFSVLLFFAIQVALIKPETIAASNVYPWVEPIGPYIIDSIGRIIPFFQDMFAELKAFFGEMSKQVDTRS